MSCACRDCDILLPRTCSLHPYQPCSSISGQCTSIHDNDSHSQPEAAPTVILRGRQRQHGHTCMWMLALYVLGNGNMYVSGNMGTTEAVSTRQLCHEWQRKLQSRRRHRLLRLLPGSRDAAPPVSNSTPALGSHSELRCCVHGGAKGVTMES